MVTDPIAFLSERIRFGIKPGLASMEALMTETGNPEKCCPVIHLAGTNGKGSTASFIASVLTEHGFKTALYTSPHLVYLNERIRLNGNTIPDAAFCRILESIRKPSEEMGMTFFEIVTAAAFLWFREQSPDFAVVETGLGGRLDATNIVDPVVSVITSVGFDHTEHLGTTLQAIASEKAGIIKTGKPVICADLPPEALGVVRSAANEKQAQLTVVRSRKPGYLARNADLAEAVISQLGKSGLIRLDSGKIRAGILNMPENTGLQGRFQRLKDGVREIILDAAHNPDGIKVLKELFRFYFGSRQPVLVFGCVGGKDSITMLRELRDLADEIHLTVPLLNRGNTPGMLKVQADSLGFSASSYPDFKQAYEAVRFIHRDRPIVICGSLYLLGEAISLFSNLKMVKIAPGGLTMNQ